MSEITNYDDVIDSRDIIERIDELREQISELKNEKQNVDDLEEELSTLEALAEEGESLSDWEYGVTLIRDSYFKEYAQEFAEDCGYIQRDRAMQWPYNCIDWDEAADELLMDYTELDFNGATYYAR